MAKKIIIAGGGTGGHIFPAIAIANALKQQSPDMEIRFIGAKGKMEMEKVPRAGYQIDGLDIAGFNRSSIFKNLGLPFKLLKSFMQVKKIVNAFQPDAVIGVGGYSSFPVLRYAQSKGIPTFIHESNSFAGKSNILLGRKATAVFVASEGMDKFFPADKILITGNPVRKEIVKAVGEREAAVKHFGLDPSKTILLAVGGSLGAKSINELIAAHVHELAQHNIELIWQTGSNGAESYKHRGQPFKNVWVDSFIYEMDKAYAAADIVVSRAGAMSVAELCVAGKPVIFVPYPHAAEDHQTVNARYLADRKAALLVKDADIRAKLFPEILHLANDASLRTSLQEHIKPLAVTNADDIIAAEILKQIR